MEKVPNQVIIRPQANQLTAHMPRIACPFLISSSLLDCVCSLLIWLEMQRCSAS